jgi:alginate O-acetyltransferase complex protein AlgJ
VFLISLVLPTIVMITGLDRRHAAGENRAFAARPKLEDLTKRPGFFLFTLKSYIQDHFGFRSQLVSLHSTVSIDVLRCSPSANVLLGQDGWLFQANEQVIDDYRRVRPWSPEQLAAWVDVFETRRKWLADRDIAYYLTIAPNTHTIHSENLPSRIRQVPDRPSRVDQLQLALASTPIRYVDARAALLESAAEVGRLYHRTDTHWNDLGAFAAARSLLDRLRTDFPEAGITDLTRSDFELTREPVPGGDLAGLIGRADTMTEEWFRLQPLQPRRAIFTPSLAEQEKHFRVLGDQSHTAVVPNHPGPTVVIMRDSFGTAILPFLAESFARTRFEWVDEWFDEKAVEAERPSIVIQEITERFLMRPPPGAFGRKY